GVVKPEQKTALRRLARGRSPAELKALFALARAHTDAELLRALKPPRAKRARTADPLAKDLQSRLRPILGPAAEKAELLVEHLAAKHKKRLEFQPSGLADAVRRLRPYLSDAQIRAGAQTLLEELDRLYSQRETVV